MGYHYAEVWKLCALNNSRTPNSRILRPHLLKANAIRAFATAKYLRNCIFLVP
jgi:hypothetical protein